MSTEIDETYMETQSAMKSAIADYVKAAGEIGLDNARIAEDIADALQEEGIKLVSTTIE